jgi:hypothetical protein
MVLLDFDQRLALACVATLWERVLLQIAAGVALRGVHATGVDALMAQAALSSLRNSNSKICYRAAMASRVQRLGTLFGRNTKMTFQRLQSCDAEITGM